MSPFSKRCRRRRRYNSRKDCEGTLSCDRSDQCVLQTSCFQASFQKNSESLCDGIRFSCRGGRSSCSTSRYREVNIAFQNAPCHRSDRRDEYRWTDWNCSCTRDRRSLAFTCNANTFKEEQTTAISPGEKLLSTQSIVMGNETNSQSFPREQITKPTSAAVIGGCIVGALLFLLFAILLIAYICKHYLRRNKDKPCGNDKSPPPAASTTVYEVPVNSQTEGHVYTTLSNYESVEPVYDSCDNETPY